MYKHEAESFAEYEVYEYVDKKKHTICICKEYKMAMGLAQTLAERDPTGDSYYVTGITYPGAFIPGGGWYYRFYQEDGRVKMDSLS